MRQAAAPGVVQTVPIDVDVVIALDRLPDAFHGDPADRLIVATLLEQVGVARRDVRRR